MVDIKSNMPHSSVVNGDLLGRLKHAAKHGQVRFSRHAVERAQERNVRREDVKNAIATATNATAQEQGTALVTGGTGLDGEALSLVCVEVQEGLFVVTVF